MPTDPGINTLRSHIKLALLREACRQNLLTEAQLRRLLNQPPGRPPSPPPV